MLFISLAQKHATSVWSSLNNVPIEFGLDLWSHLQGGGLCKESHIWRGKGGGVLSAPNMTGKTRALFLKTLLSSHFPASNSNSFRKFTRALFLKKKLLSSHFPKFRPFAVFSAQIR
uniref:Uncharacterized protein n=1 Tax=Cacopsylla melanoneura TaxID=428564 RepID=A0A8D8VDZ0_9HEMI